MESNTPKSYRHCPGENYEISIFICRGRQKAHYPKCPTCEFRTKTDETSPTPAEKETKEPQAKEEGSGLSLDSLKDDNKAVSFSSRERKVSPGQKVDL